MGKDWGSQLQVFRWVIDTEVLYISPSGSKVRKPQRVLLQWPRSASALRKGGFVVDWHSAPRPVRYMYGQVFVHRMLEGGQVRTSHDDFDRWLWPVSEGQFLRGAVSLPSSNDWPYKGASKGEAHR